MADQENDPEAPGNAGGKRKTRPAGDRYDWDAIERQYRAGAYTITEIAQHHGCTRQAISRRARLHGWAPDLTPRVQARVRALLTSEDGREPLPPPAPPRRKPLLESAPEPDLTPLAVPPPDPPPGELLSSEDVTVENAAQRTVAVIREHRATVASGRSLVVRMLWELDAVTSKQAELLETVNSMTDDAHRRALMRKAISLPQRASTMHNLTEATRKWIEMERRVFNIKDDDGRQAYEDALRALLEG